MNRFFDVYIPKNDTSKRFSYGDDFKYAQESLFIQVCADIEDMPIVPPDQFDNENAYGLYEGERVGEFFPFRVALYDGEYMNSFNPILHEKDFYQDQLISASSFCPIIHIIIEDRDTFFQDTFFVNHPNSPRFRNIMDSGIWNYYAANLEDFRRAIDDIVRNWQLGYYNLSITKEFADLNARLTAQSYLWEDPAHPDSSGHGADVSPFLFHSETRMRELLKDEGELDSLFSKYKWRYLLLDDKIDADKDDGYLTSSTNDRITKRDILIDRIKSIRKNPDDPQSVLSCDAVIYRKCDLNKVYASTHLKERIIRFPGTLEESPIPTLEDKDIDVLIVCVETKEEALELLKKYEFDIILLDYLLGEKGPNNKIHDYGYELLTFLDNLSKDNSFNDKKNKVDILRDNGYKIGPQGKFFFMFISAFTTAVSERLTLEGLSRNEEIWEIGEGACPTNTPELFKYRLVHLMKRRLSQSGIEDMQDEKILDTVAEVYQSKEGKPADRIRSVREKAYEAYHKILGLHYDYTLLRKYDRTTSRLVSHFLADKVHMGAMLEHLLQLIHLTAFGTVRQWPEIWEEFKYFTRTTNFTGKNHARLLEISKDIEQYIIYLKSE